MIEDVQVHKIESRQQWLALRKQDVTASDLAAVCGVSPYSSPLQVWADKFDKLTIEENNVMRRGRWLEDGVIAALREERPDWKISKPGAYLRSPSLRIGCTPDAWANTPDGPAVVQCKIVAKRVFETAWVDGPPLYYQLQTLAEAKLSNMDQAYLAALVIDEFTADLEVFPVPLLEPAWGRCVETVRQFWQMVERGEKPAADYAKDGATIGKLYRSVTGGEPIDLTHDNRMVQVVREYTQEGQKEKAAKLARDALKAEIVEKLHGHRKAIVGDTKISNSPVSVKEHFVKASDYDRLTVTPPKI